MGRHSTQVTPRERERTLFRALGAVALLAIVLIAAWLLTRPEQRSPEPGNVGGGLVVDATAELPISGRYVGFVLAGRVSLPEVLRRNALPADGVTALGGGTYVVDVGERSAGAVIEGLRADPAIASAGPVFEGPAGKESSEPTTGR